MKKGFLIIAILAIFMIQLSVVGAYEKGDINEDGYIDVFDTELVMEYIVDGLAEDDKKLVEKNGDMNGDGKISQADATEIGKNQKDGNVDLDGTYGNLKTETKSCGKGMIKDIPSTIPKVTRIVYIAMQVATPIILVLLGMIDLVKAITSGKEEDVKKSQGLFIKRLISASAVFFVFVIVKLLVSLVAPDNDDSEKLEENRKVNRIMSCVDCFLNGTDNCDK